MPKDFDIKDFEADPKLWEQVILDALRSIMADNMERGAK